MAKFILGPFAATALLLSVAQAPAAIVTITYEGTVTSSTGVTDLFGGGDLVGRSWVATYVFDTAVGSTSSPSSSGNFAYGGSHYGSDTPLLTSSLTIGGSYSFTFGQTTKDEIYGYNCGPACPSQQNHSAVNYSVKSEGDKTFYVYDYLENIVSNKAGTIPGTIDKPFVYFVQAGDFQGASFQLYSYAYDAVTREYIFGPATAIQASLFKLSETVEGPTALATPLPAALPLFASGVGGLAFLLGWRRRRLS